MDPKELKALLKEAKDSIKSKDYATTTKNCKLILKKIPDHYQANLFLGTSMLEQGKWAQSIESYKKAAEIDPKQIYAWQGIILNYERQNIKQHKDLLDAYKRVATFYEKDDDKSKYIESTKKLANALISQQDNQGAYKVLVRLFKSYGVDLEMAGMIQHLLSGTVYGNRNPEENLLYTEALKTTVTQSPQPSDDICKKYFTQLYKCGRHEEVVAQAISMKVHWNFYSSPMEWLCRYYIEERLVDSKQIAEIGPFDVVTDKLFKLYPSSSFGHFGRGKFLIDAGKEMMDGFAFIRTGLESNLNLHALMILIRGRIDYGDFEGAVEDCSNGLRSFSTNPEVCKTLRLCLTEAWLWLDWKKAEELLENTKSSDEPDSQWILLNIKLSGKKLDFAFLRKYLAVASEKNIQHWTVDFFKAILEVDLTNGQILKDAIEGQLSLDQDNFHLALEASILLFNLKFYQESAYILVNVTKTEIGRRRPYSWKYLGQLYSLQDDKELAAKCYKKSYKLCPCADVGALLSDTYFILDKEDLNLELLSKASKSFAKSKSKWAWLRLGIFHLHKDQANEAVTALQACIRADITDGHVWESLADAYFLRGSYGPALCSYKRAIELGADPLYPKLRIGVVHQCLGQHDESIQALKSLLDEYPENYTVVLVELARTHALIANDMTSENYDIRAKAAMEDSLAYAVLAVLQSPKRILLPWNIIGESALTLNNLPDNETVRVPTFLLGDNPNLLDATKVKSIEAFEYKHVSMEKLREIGIEAMLECLRMIESSPKADGPTFSKNLHAYVYHQLALLYFHRGRRFSTKGDVKLSTDMFKKAIIAVKKAVAANQTKYIYWNTLGVIAYFTGNDELSQHAFIKSLEIVDNNVVAWCNLGMLYLKHDKPMLAHEVFTKAQSVSPLHSFSWIGQGLVAEHIQPTDAADLFRHAAHLEPSSFGVSCYADWISRILLKEVILTPMDYWYAVIRVDALTIVNDLITKVEVRNRTPHLFNMKGISAALNGFYSTALDSFITALDLAKDPSFSISHDQTIQILLNKIVMLVKLQRFSEAVDAFSTIENLDRVGYAVGALTMSKLGFLEHSEKLYDQLIDSLPEGEAKEEDMINATIALGLVKNIRSGPESACDLLLQDFMVKSPHGLLALSAIGIMNNDTEFLRNVMPHLEDFEQDEDVLADIGLMKTCFHIMNGNSKKGVNELLKLVHTNPMNPRLWTILSQIVFNYEFDSIHSSTFRQITMTALKLSSCKPKGMTDSIYSKSSAMISLCYLMKDDWNTAIVTALTGIKKYPNERENWIVLACAFWYQFAETRNIKIYHKVVTLLEKELLLNRIHRRAEEWASAFLQIVKTYQPSSIPVIL